MRWHTVLSAVVLGMVTVSAGQATRAAQPVGGGSTDGGFVGEYFANPKLEGEAVFTRRDVRIRFDWGEKLPVIGSNADGWREFPRDHYAIRWTGRVVPRFGETYTFAVVSDEGARLWIRDDGRGDWTRLVDNWQGHVRTEDTATFAMTAGKTYEIKLEYRDDTGPAVVELAWSSKSTPRELIEPLSSALISGNTYTPMLWANIGRVGQMWKVQPEQMDANGWPLCDVIWPPEGGWRSPAGRYGMRFNGKAEVRVNGATFVVGEQTFRNVLPAGVGYDEATNTTTAGFDWPEEQPIVMGMSKTQREAKAAVGSGFANLQIMKPLASGAKQAHRFGETLTRGMREAWGPYPIFRWQTTGLSDAVKWSERTPPTWCRVQQYEKAMHNQTCLEDLVLMANESGRDVQINFGGSVDQEYMRKLALLCRYGSDGKEPYEHEVENPTYPPLNPNLRVYLEHGNEMGWSAIQPRKWHQDLVELRQKNDPEWQIINYDGRMKEGVFEATYRYHALRTLRCSEQFRAVFGDAAMGDRVRPLLFGQAGQQYEPSMLQFVDSYFNNGDGKQHVREPHPVNYYFYGTGVAIYYGSANAYGQLNPEPVADNSFESAQVAEGAGVLRPQGTPWTFAGRAGVCDVRLPRRAAIKQTKPAALEPVGEGWAGMKLKVGAKDVYVYQLGTAVAEGAKAIDRTLAVFSAGRVDRDYLGGVRALQQTMLRVTDAQAGEWRYNAVEFSGWPVPDSYRQGPLRLAAGQTYYAVLRTAAGDQLPGAQSVVEADPAIEVQAAVTSGDGVKFTEVADGAHCLGLLNMIITDAGPQMAEGELPVPPNSTQPPVNRHQQEPLGNKVAFVCGNGSIRQEVQFPAAGEYAILFRAAGSQVQANPFSVFIDEQCVWERKGAGAPRKSFNVLYAYSTDVVKLAAGKHAVRFVGTSDSTEACVFLDGVQVVSLDRILSTIPERGQETSGNTATRYERMLRKMCDFARLWGVVPCTYEGGWSLGGDWDAGGMNHWEYAKYRASQTVDVGFRSTGLYSQAGGWMFAYGTYDQFPTMRSDRAADYPLWQAVSKLSRTWTHEPDNGLAIPGLLTSEQDHYTLTNDARGTGFYGPTVWSRVRKDPQLKAGEWKAWIVIAAKTADYRLTAVTTGGGKIRMLCDELPVAAADAGAQPVSGTVRITRGQHAIKVRCIDGNVELKQVEVQAAP